MQYTYEYESPVGTLTLAADGESLTGLWMKGQKYYASALCGGEEHKELPVFTKTVKWLDAYFRGENLQPLPPLAPKGSDFQKQVWEILCAIPYGTTVTYGDIAVQIAKKRGIPRMAAQPVGGAVGHNPISILIPCHRVVGKDGSLTGYAGGIDKKVFLLRLEGVDTSGFTVPKRSTAP